jgi:hypothetical protein
MSTRPLKFKRCEVVRALKAAADAGTQVARLEISPNGTLRIYPRAPLERVETVPPEAKVTTAHGGGS